MKDRDEHVKDLAFDIRAQRHMFFYRKAPDGFERELTSSLKQMIVSDFTDWSRKRLWNQLLGRRGEVSIFTGALHNETFDREMIGDWDLRAASELTSYFARQQYRATIENPVYTPEYPKRDKAAPLDRYIASLKDLLQDKNCILIASPDVNPLTEVVLGHAYGIDDSRLFGETREGEITEHPDAMAVIKVKTGARGDVKSAKRFFYREEFVGGDGPSRRGFESPQLVQSRVMEEFVSQVDSQKEEFRVFGQIMILRNPFGQRQQDSPRFIVVLNGVSGPATFALTHVLTGGVTKEFVAYPSDFDPEASSEAIVRQLLDELLDQLSRPGADDLDCMVSCIVTVRVGRADGPPKQGSEDISDWRKVRGWEVYPVSRAGKMLSIR